MTAPIFTFSRVPSTKVRTKTEIDSLVQADSTLVIIGRQGATAGTVTDALNGQSYIENFGDPVLAALECVTKFGASAEITEMVVAAIKGNLFSNAESKSFPKILCIPMSSANTSADLAAKLALNLSVAMPFLVVPFPASDTVAMTAVKDHATAISGDDKGINGQFGTSAFLATDGSLAVASAAGLAGALELINVVWLRDTAVTKANKVHEVASAYAAVCAGMGIPFNPLNNIKVGGLVAPVSAQDWQTTGDTGLAALALEAGVSPLSVTPSTGDVKIVRSITTRRPVPATPEVAYFDLQDWLVLFYTRKLVYVLAQQPRYKNAKASVPRILALKSEILSAAVELEKLEMLQHVALLADQFTAERQSNNRHAAVYRIPLNVIPGFMNKGIELVGTTQFDSVIA